VRTFVRENPVLIGALALVAVVFAYAAIALFAQQGRCDGVDAARWRGESTTGRERLASDLEACGTLNGKRAAQVHADLGTPRAISSATAPRRGTVWRYPTGSGGFDPRVLEVYVTPTGVVDEVRFTGL
jgi:hypothetical protein